MRPGTTPHPPPEDDSSGTAKGGLMGNRNSHELGVRFPENIGKGAESQVERPLHVHVTLRSLFKYSRPHPASGMR